MVFDTLGDDPEPVRHRIVGVVATTHYNRPSEPDRPTIYTPFTAAAAATLNVRADSTSPTMVQSLHKQIESAAPVMRIGNTILLASQIDNTMLSERLLAMLATFFSIVALLLAFVGLYGVVNYAAVRRTREIGVRIALGARTRSVIWLIASGSAIPVVAGIGIGIVGGLALAHYLVSQLFGVKATDFWSLAAPIACIVAAAIAATFPPALRAASADPLTALHHE